MRKHLIILILLCLPSFALMECERAPIQPEPEFPEAEIDFTRLTFRDTTNFNVITPINDEKEWTGWRNITWEKMFGNEQPQEYTADLQPLTEWDGFDSAHWIYGVARAKLQYNIEPLNHNRLTFSFAYPQPCVNNPKHATIEIIITQDGVETFRSDLIPKTGKHFEIPINARTHLLQIDISPIGANTCDYYALVEPQLITQ